MRKYIHKINLKPSCKDPSPTNLATKLQKVDRLFRKLWDCSSLSPCLNRALVFRVVRFISLLFLCNLIWTIVAASQRYFCLQLGRTHYCCALSLNPKSVRREDVTYPSTWPDDIVQFLSPRITFGAFLLSCGLWVCCSAISQFNDSRSCWQFWLGYQSLF